MLKSYNISSAKCQSISLFYFPNRILLCANCGDHYPVELILGPLFSNQSCSKYPNRNDSVMLETFVGSEKKKVLITFTSYHRKQQCLVVTCYVQIQIVKMLVCDRYGKQEQALHQRETWKNLFLSNEGPMLKTLDSTIHISSTPTFLYFNLWVEK